MLVNYKEICSLHGLRFVSLQASLDVEGKKGFFKQNRWRFSKKAKGLIVFAIIAVMLISVFAFLPKQGASIVQQHSDNSTVSPSATQAATNKTQSNSPFSTGPILNNLVDGHSPAFVKAPGIIGSAQTINSTVWTAVAQAAWKYFQPGTGVDSNTGLPYAGGSGFQAFTDWDLGVYIQSVIDAQKIGLIGTDGDWGSYARLDKVLTFLETRELNNASYPYWFYNATTGKDDHTLSDTTNATVDVVDTGRLFVALNNLRNFNSNFTTRVDNFVYNRNGNRSDYADLVHGLEVDRGSNSIYAYYYDSGYASFWPQFEDVPRTILDTIVNSGNIITIGNASLPKAAISCDPLLCSVFELNNNSSKLMALANEVYLAHEAYYNATGKYVAFSEGNSPSNGFIWEWVVLPNGDTWKVENQTGLASYSYLGIDPIVYNKVAFSFLSLYNTTFARNMVVFLEQTLPDPTNGYSDGADNSGNLAPGVGSNTNGLILDAAQYYIQHNP